MKLPELALGKANNLSHFLANFCIERCVLKPPLPAVSAVSLGLSPSGRQVIHFKDHTTYEADLVIGADGIKSITRNAVNTIVSDGHFVFSDTYAYPGLIPIDMLKLAGLKADVQSSPHCWVGLSSMCSMCTFLFEILN